MAFLDRTRHWAAANLVPLVLIPLALGLIWVAVWRVWLPFPAGVPARTRTVTTVNANATRLPTHKVTTVVRTARGASPSRRSEVLALALILLGTGPSSSVSSTTASASVELGQGRRQDRLKRGRALGRSRAGRPSRRRRRDTRIVREGLDRYLRSIAARRPERLVLGSDGRAGIGTDQAASLAERIADDLV